MVSQNEIDFMNMKIEALEKESVSLNKKYQQRGKALNKLWEKREELVKEIAKLKEFCGKLTYDISRIHLENRITVPPALKGTYIQNKQFLVKDILMQLLNETHSLEFNVLQKKIYSPVGLKTAEQETKK